MIEKPRKILPILTANKTQDARFKTSGELKLDASAVVEDMADKLCWMFGELTSTSITAFAQWLPPAVAEAMTDKRCWMLNVGEWQSYG